MFTHHTQRIGGRWFRHIHIYLLHIYLLFCIHHWLIFNCFPRKSRLRYQKATTREICHLLLHTAFEAVYSAPLYWVPNIDTIKYLIAAKLQLNLKHCDSNIASLLSQHWAHPHWSAPLKGPVTLINRKLLCNPWLMLLWYTDFCQFI